MASKCDLTGKRAMSGNNVSFSLRRTKRTFKPNLQTKTVVINGKKAPIRGRVCMDQFMVDVTDIPDVKFGDKVTLVGKDGDEFLPVETLSDLSGRFNYEFVCDLGKRIPREYIQNGQVIEQVDYFDV